MHYRTMIMILVVGILFSATLVAQEDASASDLDHRTHWLMTGIEEANNLDDISEADLTLVVEHLQTLLDDEDLRSDEAYHAAFVSELEAQNVPAEAIEIVERAFVRISSPLNYHEGYWFAEIPLEGIPVPAMLLNDIHVDAYTGDVTVYGQLQLLGEVIAPVQAGPGETAEHFSGNILGMHPNGVYLNGSGEELTEADGTGSWWIKHPILSPDGYNNWALLTSDYSFGGQYIEGTLLEDGVTMVMRAFFEDEITGFPVDNDAIANEFYGNLRRPNLEPNTITHETVRYEPANLDPDAGPIDYTTTIQNRVIFECIVEPSEFDGLARACPPLNN